MNGKKAPSKLENLRKKAKENPLLFAAILSFVLLIIYLAIFYHINSDVQDMNAHKFHVIFTEYKVSCKTIISSMLISYLLGCIFPALGWRKANKECDSAHKNISGMKGKLEKVEKEKQFFENKVKILEGGINSAAPGGGGGGGGGGRGGGGGGKKKKSPKAKIIAGIIILLVTFLSGVSYSSKKDSIINDVKNKIFSDETKK